MNDVEILGLKDVKNPIKSHFHEFYVIGFVEKGCRKMLCNGVEYLLCPGDALVFNPFDVHSCKIFGSAPMKYFSVNIKESFVQSAFRGELPVFQNVIKSSTSFPLGVLCDFKKLKDKSGCLKFLENLPHSFESRERALMPEIQTVCRIIEENLSNKITLDFLAETSGLSKSSLLRAFLAQKGITPYKYVETLRVEKAKTLLLKGVLPVDTSLALGFSSQSHFINSFKSLTGLAPGAFRKEVKCI